MTTESLTRTLSLLHHVAEHGPATVEELAAGTGLPLSTAHRNVLTLVQVGYLAPCPVRTGRDTGRVGVKAARYGPGARLAELVRQTSCTPRRLGVATAAVRRVAPQSPEPWARMVAVAVLDALDRGEQR